MATLGFIIPGIKGTFYTDKYSGNDDNHVVFDQRSIGGKSYVRAYLVTDLLRNPTTVHDRLVLRERVGSHSWLNNGHLVFSHMVNGCAQDMTRRQHPDMYGYWSEVVGELPSPIYKKRHRVNDIWLMSSELKTSPVDSLCCEIEKPTVPTIVKKVRPVEYFEYKGKEYENIAQAAGARFDDKIGTILTEHARVACKMNAKLLIAALQEYIDDADSNDPHN